MSEMYPPYTHTMVQPDRVPSYFSMSSAQLMRFIVKQGLGSKRGQRKKRKRKERSKGDNKFFTHKKKCFSFFGFAHKTTNQETDRFSFSFGITVIIAFVHPLDFSHYYTFPIKKIPVIYVLYMGLELPLQHAVKNILVSR